jgi:methionyl-tRNA formyltransferase
MNKEKIIIVTIKSWNLNNAEKFKELYKKEYDIFIFSKKEELSFDVVKKINPKYIFFPHWSWIIPKEIHDNFESIVFHMTDLPYGRGGSPLQNLIIRKVYDTKISAIKVEDGLDTGPVYLKKDFYIGLGSAEEIFQKMSGIIFFEMIPYILKKCPKNFEQEGQPVIFKRRKKEESDLNKNQFTTLNDLYDFIRMLDAQSYPKAFFKVGNLKIEFSVVQKRGDRLNGFFEIVEELEE